MSVTTQFKPGDLVYLFEGNRFGHKRIGTVKSITISEHDYITCLVQFIDTDEKLNIPEDMLLLASSLNAPKLAPEEYFEDKAFRRDLIDKIMSIKDKKEIERLLVAVFNEGKISQFEEGDDIIVLLELEEWK